MTETGILRSPLARSLAWSRGRKKVGGGQGSQDILTSNLETHHRGSPCVRELIPFQISANHGIEGLCKSAHKVLNKMFRGYASDILEISIKESKMEVKTQM